MIKICSKCKIEYDNAIEHFKKDSTKLDELYSSCKKCNKKDWQENYPNIAEKHRAKNLKYANNNKEKIRMYLSIYYQENKDYFKEKAKLWNTQNPEKRKSSHSKDKAHRRALLAQVRNDLTAKEIREQYSEQNGKCFYCNKEVGTDYHVDHIIPIIKGGENTKDNIVITCPDCNLSKGIKTASKFQEYRICNG